MVYEHSRIMFLTHNIGICLYIHVVLVCVQYNNAIVHVLCTYIGIRAVGGGW